MFRNKAAALGIPNLGSSNDAKRKYILIYFDKKKMQKAKGDNGILHKKVYRVNRNFLITYIYIYSDV